MPVLFQANRHGSVAVFNLRAGADGTVILAAEGGRAFRSQSAIITSVSLGQAVNIQFMPTLADLVYVYSFGDKMGQSVIQGLAFDRVCRRGGASRRGVGPDYVMDFYKDNRAVRENKRVTVNIGSNAVSGFLTDMQIQTANTELKTMSFTMRIATLPDTRRRRR